MSLFRVDREKQFRVDPYVPHIDEKGPPCTYGLNIMAFPIGRLGDDFRERYEQFRERAKELFPFAYIYPYRFIHITVGPPCLFTQDPLMREELRPEFERLWTEKVRAMQLPPAFDLHYRTIQLDNTAGIFLPRDDDGAIAKIRNALRQISDEIRQVNAEFPEIRIPSIIHSTFLRYERQPDISVEEMHSRWKQLEACWGEQDVTVRASELVLIQELRPYLHQPPGLELANVPYSK